MEHYYQNIQGWFCYTMIYDMAVGLAKDGDLFVEVGSWKGKSTCYLAVEIVNSGKRIRLDCVDTWKGTPSETVHQEDPSVINGTLYQEFLKNIEPVNQFIHTKRMTSERASHYYDDGSIDFVLLDAGHEYDDVKKDINYWISKVKPGGILAGDDYNWPGVRQAVNELLPAAFVVSRLEDYRNDYGFAGWVYKKPL